MVKLLSLDTSIRNTGWALYKDCKLKDYGVIAASSNLPLDEMMRNLSALFNEIKPQIIVIENPVVLRNAKVQRALSELLGATRFWCVNNDCLCYPINPTEWRKLVKDKDEILPKARNDLKKWSLLKANKYSKHEITSNDISDAILIGKAYINLTIN